jgi:hypothetical protein
MDIFESRGDLSAPKLLDDLGVAFGTVRRPNSSRRGQMTPQGMPGERIRAGGGDVISIFNELVDSGRVDE